MQPAEEVFYLVMRLSKSINKDQVYVSFPDVNGKLVNEYIPKDVGWLGFKVKEAIGLMYAKRGIEIYYWNLRHIMVPETIKQGDLQFIIHVIEDHDGVPTDWRERRFYNKLLKLYYYDVEWFIKPMTDENKSKDPIVHPYYLAYKKRWIKPKDSNFKRSYHGLNRAEAVEMIEIYIEQIKKRRSRFFSQKSYYKKQLK